MKRFIDPSYTLPDGWYASKLIELAEIHNNRRKPINSLERVNMKGPFPYCGANNVVDYINKYEFDGEYLLIAEDGGYWGKNEPTSYIMRGKFWVNNHAHIVKAKEGKTTNQFLCYILNYLNLDPIIGGDARGKLTKAVLTELLIPHPDFPEQRKIAYVLSTVQKAIEQQDKLIRTTTELKKALMQKLFTEGTKGEKLKQTEIGWVPESWEVTTIGKLYDFTSKPRGLNIELPVPFIPMEIVPMNEIYIEKYELRESLRSGTYVENGDLLLAKITPSFENGKQGVVRINKSYSYATTEVIPIKEKEKVSDKFYLFYYLLKDDVRKALTDKMEGSTGRQRLSKTILEETLIPKPPFDEQKEIAQIFLSFNERLSFLQKKKQTLTNLFKTLLHELMTGQRRVHELEFEFEGLNKEYKIVEQPLSMVAEK
jgi:type I restriction enzyme S subunit